MMAELSSQTLGTQSRRKQLDFGPHEFHHLVQKTEVKEIIVCHSDKCLRVLSSGEEKATLSPASTASWRFSPIGARIPLTLW